MGNRLVCVIEKDSEILAASYQHWEAAAHREVRKIIDDNISNWDKEINQAEAVKILEKSIKEYNGNDSPIVLELEHYDWSENPTITKMDNSMKLHFDSYSSEDEKKFASLHPELDTDWNKADRSYGILCINKDKIEEWTEWAEWEELIEI